jgi:hypothetical protein
MRAKQLVIGFHQGAMGARTVLKARFPLQRLQRTQQMLGNIRPALAAGMPEERENLMLQPAGSFCHPRFLRAFGNFTASSGWKVNLETLLAEKISSVPDPAIGQELIGRNFEIARCRYLRTLPALSQIEPWQGQNHPP